MNLGGIGAGTRVVHGEIKPADYVGVDWYSEPGYVDQGFFNFDVFDFTATKSQLLTITVDVDSSQSHLYPYIYLFSEGNAPDLSTPVSVWTLFDDTTTDVDFYPVKSATDPGAPVIASGEGAGMVLQADVQISDPDFRLMVTGSYYDVTGGNFWWPSDGVSHAGNYSLTFNGAAVVPEPASYLLLVLGLLVLAALRQHAHRAVSIPLPERR